MTQNPNNTVPIWLNETDAAKLLSVEIETLRKKCRAGFYSYKVVIKNKRREYAIRFASLSEDMQKKFFIGESQISHTILQSYSDVPIWAKIQAEKYISILNATENLKGKELKDFIRHWNEVNPQYKTSYQCVNKMRQRYKADGVNGLLAQYGKNLGSSVVDDKYFEYFKNLYLVEGAPSLLSCYELTKGFAVRMDGVKKYDFPQYLSFLRRLKNEVPKQSIYLARYGEARWNKKYGSYIERDYSGTLCNEVWVSDHAQLDIGCLTEDGRVCYPWITAWRDYKSSKWLGWILQPASPNSDFIFQSFYYAANQYGLPKDVIIDNGKDYRCKDFAGGRKIVKIGSNEARATSMLAELDVKVHFAQPYNAQTKPIERDFLKIKDYLSKHSVGYRGGNVQERPERLIKEIKAGKLLPFDKLKEVFDDFIINVLNKKPSQGKNLKGLSPDALFFQEYKEKTTPSKEALKLFCMRTSKTYTIKRNGIKDSGLDIRYWADWLIAQNDVKVYLRRDVQNYAEAWVFKADNDEFLGKVFAAKPVAALHANKISKNEYKEAIAIKNQAKKIAKAYAQQTDEIGLVEKCENYKALYIDSVSVSTPKVSKLANTNMDKAIKKQKAFEKIGKQDLSAFLPEESDDKLYLLKTDILIEKELKEVKNGR